MVPYLICTLIFAIGVYAIIAKKNLIKIVIGLLVLEYATNLLLVLVGYRSGGGPPIIVQQNMDTSNFVDPLPQALVLTSIVIGLGITALVVALCIRLYEKYKTFDISKIKRLKG